MSIKPSSDMLSCHYAKLDPKSRMGQNKDLDNNEQFLNNDVKSVKYA